MNTSTKQLASSVGVNIRRERMRRDYSQEQLAEKAGITPQYLSLLENGDRCGSISTYLGLSNTLGLTLSALVSPVAGFNENPAGNDEGTFHALFAESSPFERRVMIAILAAAKEAMRSDG